MWHLLRKNFYAPTLFRELRITNSVVIYAATWATFKPKLKIIKKILPEKNCSPKTYLTIFYTLNKTPLGETGRLSNNYYLLAAQASIF